MWIFSKYGFFSAVRLTENRENTNDIMIRARRSEHLEKLKERFPSKIGDAEILEQPGSDYLFRIIVPLQAWGSIAAHLAGECDYGNFKNEATRSFGYSDPYVSALHDVWSTMYSTQPSGYQREVQIPLHLQADEPTFTGPVEYDSAPAEVVVVDLNEGGGIN